MKRLLSLVLALALALSVFGCAPAEQQTTEADTTVAQTTVAQTSADETTAPAKGYTPGTYTATGFGMWGEMTVEVTVDETSITDISVPSYEDTEYLIKAAITDMAGKIIKNQSLAVDTTAGATLSSAGILRAVEQALTEAGGDMEALTAELPKADNALPDESFDIVIVGGGGTGLSAGMWAAQSGEYSVLVLEQNAMTGGTTCLSDGGISAGSSNVVTSQGMWNATGEQYADFIVQQTDALEYLPDDVSVNRTLLAKIGDRAGIVFDYLTGEGLDMFTYPLKQFIPDTNIGYTIALPNATTNARNIWGTWFTELAIKNGANVRTNSKVVELLLDNGAVTGVKVETPEGHYNVSAKKVILATGGFANNMELLKKYNTDLPGIGSAWSYTNGGAKGSVFELVADLDVPSCGYGMLADLGTVIPHGTCTDIGNPVINGFYCTVDSNGARYTDSAKVQYGRTYDLLRLEDGTAYAISSATSIPSGSGSTFDGQPASVYAETMKALGACYEGDTIEELAAQIGADPDTLKASIAAHNDEARSGKISFYYAPLDVVVEEGPYYAFVMKPCILATLYGIQINDNFQVVNSAGEAIPNLFAAGECAMGNFIVGEYPCGGSALTMGIYGGTLAVDQAISEME